MRPRNYRASEPSSLTSAKRFAVPRILRPSRPVWAITLSSSLMVLTIGCHWPALSLVAWWPGQKFSPPSGSSVAAPATPRVTPASSVGESGSPPSQAVASATALPHPATPSSSSVVASQQPPAHSSPGKLGEPLARAGISQASHHAAASADEAEKLDQLVRAARQRYAAIQDYVCRFRRREVLGNGQVSEDLLLLRFRKQPLSIHLVWPKGSPEEGREVVYVQGRFNNQLVIRTGRGDFWSGLRVELALDSPRATANTRRHFLEIGVGYLIESLHQVIHEQRQGTYRFGRLSYAGQRPRPESPTPMECLAQEIPPNLEKYLPRGGKRYFFIATEPRLQEYQLPVLVVAHDDTGREVEYYCYDRFNINIGLDDSDFDPDRLWARK